MSNAPTRHSQRRELHIHGPSPPPLRLISKQSRNIRKQNMAAPPEAKSDHRHPPPPPPAVIIYIATPKVIHVDPSEFMSLVQRLTGSNSTTSSSSSTLNMTPPPPPSASGGGVVYPAAPPEWSETQFFDGGDEMPQNLLLNETDSDQMMSMSSSSVSESDILNYLFDNI